MSDVGDFLNIVLGNVEQDCFKQLAQKVSTEAKAGKERPLWSILQKLSQMNTGDIDECVSLYNRASTSVSVPSGQPKPGTLSGVLAIGVDNYDATDRWDNLDYCLCDARCVSEGAPSQVNVTLSEDPDRGLLWKAIEDFTEKMSDNTVLLIFYAGHGCQHEGEFYMVPKDSTRFHDYVSLGAIMRTFESQRRGCTLILCLAACRASIEDKEACEKAFDRYASKGGPKNEYILSYACPSGFDMEEDKTNLVDGHTPYAHHLALKLPELAGETNVVHILRQLHWDVSAATNFKEQPWLYISSAPPESESISHRTSSESSIRASSHGRNKSGYSIFPEKVSCTMRGPELSVAEDIRRVHRKRVNRISIKEVIKPSIIILTDTQGKSAYAALETFAVSGMGPHYLIERNGSLVRFVDEDLCAWCANPAFWGSGTIEGTGLIPGVGYVNEVHNHGLSIALEGDGKNMQYTPEQYDKLIPLAKSLIKKFDIMPWNIVGLAEVCVPADRYDSPGRCFQWSQLAHQGLIFDTAALRKQENYPTQPSQFKDMMIEWGYSLGCDGDQNRGFRHRLSSFRERYSIKCLDDRFLVGTDDVLVLSSLLDRRKASLRDV